jgi:hypothetical protein
MTQAESNENRVEDVEVEVENQAAVEDGVPQAPAEEKEPKEAAAVEPEPEKKESFMQAATSEALRPFVIISSSYLLFTITDGAIRMIVLLHAYTKKFSAFEVAIMFTLYELAGVFTNLVSGFNRRIKLLPYCVDSIQICHSFSTTGCWFHGRTVGHQIYIGQRIDVATFFLRLTLWLARRLDERACDYICNYIANVCWHSKRFDQTWWQNCHQACYPRRTRNQTLQTSVIHHRMEEFIKGCRLFLG